MMGKRTAAAELSAGGNTGYYGKFVRKSEVYRDGTAVYGYQRDRPALGRELKAVQNRKEASIKPIG